MGFSFFKNSTGPTTAEQTVFARPFCLKIKETEFIQLKTRALYERILKRCYHKTGDINKEESNQIALSMFMSIEFSNKNNGTIPLVARAMESNQRIALVYDSNLGLTRIANTKEQTLLMGAYNNNRNAIAEIEGGLRGMVLDFTNSSLTKLIKSYMAMIYAVMDSANTQVNLARSLQIKLNKLRESISVNSSPEAITAAKDINAGLKEGKSALLDSGDIIIQTAIDAKSIEDALNIFYSALASDLGLSVSFVSGVLTSGMSATGDADINYEENGIKDFWVSVWRPIMLKLYNQQNIKFLTDRWRLLQARMQTLVFIENSSLFNDKEKRAFAEELLNGQI